MADSNDTSDRGFLRGLQSYGDRDFSIYMRRAFAKSMGYTGEELGRPIVGIAYTHSRFNPCHRHFPELLDAIKRGVAAAGGLALEFPTTSLHEFDARPQLHEVPQPHGHGHRGDDPRPADGLSRADGRLRQDRAGAADGRGQRRQARHPADRRPADDLALQGRSRGSLHRLPQVLDAVPRRQARPCRHRRGGGAARHHGRHLRRHGHGIHHGGHRRGAGHDAAGHGGDSRRARRSPAGGGGDRRARRCAGAVGSDARQDHHGRIDRERRARAAGARRLHQRRHPSRRHRRPARPRG